MTRSKKGMKEWERSDDAYLALPSEKPAEYWSRVEAQLSRVRRGLPVAKPVDALDGWRAQAAAREAWREIAQRNSIIMEEATRLEEADQTPENGVQEPKSPFQHRDKVASEDVIPHQNVEPKQVPKSTETSFETNNRLGQPVDTTNEVHVGALNNDTSAQPDSMSSPDAQRTRVSDGPKRSLRRNYLLLLSSALPSLRHFAPPAGGGEVVWGGVPGAPKGSPGNLLPPQNHRPRPPSTLGAPMSQLREKKEKSGGRGEPERENNSSPSGRHDDCSPCARARVARVRRLCTRFVSSASTWGSCAPLRVRKRPPPEPTPPEAVAKASPAGSCEVVLSPELVAAVLAMAEVRSRQGVSSVRVTTGDEVAVGWLSEKLIGPSRLWRIYRSISAVVAERSEISLNSAALLAMTVPDESTVGGFGEDEESVVRYRLAQLLETNRVVLVDERPRS